MTTATCLTCPRTDAHEPHEWFELNRPYPTDASFVVEIPWPCGGICGCATSRESGLWEQIADEIDAYLDGDDDDSEGLF